MDEAGALRGEDAISREEAIRWLPPAMRRVAELIGEEAVLQIIEKVGGATIYVPAQPKCTSLIVQLVGMNAAQRLASDLGGSKLIIPPCHVSGPATRRRQGMALLRDGASISEVAFKLRAARSTVQGWRRKL